MTVTPWTKRLIIVGLLVMATVDMFQGSKDIALIVAGGLLAVIRSDKLETEPSEHKSAL